MPSLLSILCKCYSNPDYVVHGKIIEKPLLLFIPEESKLDKDNIIKFLVKVNPKAKEEDKENTCKKSIWIFKNGTPDDVLCWLGKVQHII